MKSTRKLAWGDTFRLARIINTGEIKPADIVDLIDRRERKQAEAIVLKHQADAAATEEEKAQIFEKIEKIKNDAVIDFLVYILEKFPLVETPLNSFLASMADVKPDKIEKAEIGEIVELIKDIIEQNKDIGSFFTSALKSAEVMSST
jgi:hypothetical protein